MLAEILNQSSIDGLSRFTSEFAHNKPFKHLVIDDFFKPEFTQRMLDEFPSFDDKLAMNENGEVGRKAVHEKVTGIGPAYKQLDELARSEEFREYVAKLTGIENLIYDPYYFGGGTHNNLSGQDLDPHVDFTHHPITGDHRRLNLIVYLNKEWHEEWGGNIEFHKNPRLNPADDDIISVEPLFNRAVVFETNNISWHGFPRIELPQDKAGLSRKSFALYYYTHQREHPVKPHSTIYVERHLPERFVPGLQLDEQSLQEIRILLARRDQHLERLYNNISHLMSENSDLKNKLSQINHQLSQLEKATDQPRTTTPQQKVDPPMPYEHQALIQRIHDLEHSTSWKITAPLRTLKRLISGRQ
jgi:hypothetical protein